MENVAGNNVTLRSWDLGLPYEQYDNASLSRLLKIQNCCGSVSCEETPDEDVSEKLFILFRKCFSMRFKIQRRLYVKIMVVNLWHVGYESNAAFSLHICFGRFV